TIFRGGRTIPCRPLYAHGGAVCVLFCCRSRRIWQFFARSTGALRNFSSRGVVGAPAVLSNAPRHSAGRTGGVSRQNQARWRASDRRLGYRESRGSCAYAARLARVPLAQQFWAFCHDYSAPWTRITGYNSSYDSADEGASMSTNFTPAAAARHESIYELDRAIVTLAARINA